MKNQKIQQLEEIANLSQQNLKTIDGHDNAIRGYCTIDNVIRVVYSKDAIIKNLMKQKMTREKAEEYYDYNIESSFNYKDTEFNYPIVMEKL